MLIIAERINGMFTDVKQAIANKDKKVIQDLAKKQTDAVGTAAADQEGTIQWLVESIQETCSTPLCLDSQKPDVIAAGLKVLNADNGGILNSTPLNKKNDDEILDRFIEMATQAGPKVGIIALTMDKN
ncbi:MAG: pterin-binding domain-containing protein, partial [Planctomycetota bacterium]